jgi:multicomponent Na+:H+ antiporter subunit D
MSVTVPPGLILVVGALLLALVKGALRDGLVLLLPLLTLAAVWMVPEGYAAGVPFLDYTLEPVEWSRAGRVFATIFAIMAFVGGLYALRTASTLELVAAFLYAGSAVGVTFAGDLLTMFVFWELMAVGSAMVLWASDQPGAYRSSMRYLLVHLFGGVLLMIGIVSHITATGSADFGPMSLEPWYGWLILAGMLVNAGAPPLGAWIADAYPEASPSGMVFLSAFTTKTAVFTLLVAFPGEQVLIWFGLYMAVYGVVYAFLENDMRRILAYSIVNQVGFMVVGVGIGTEMAINGVTAHAFAHIVYKALLLMSAGSVLYMTGRRRVTGLGGLVRSMPVTAGAAIVGTLTLASIPYTSSFASKSLLTQSAAEEHLALAWFVLYGTAAAIFLAAGLKFVWLVFFGEDSGLRPSDPPASMRWPMWILAGGCLGIGLFPDPLFEMLPYPVEYDPYSAYHLVGQSQVVLFAGLAFFLVLPVMQRTATLTLDFDWFYRRFGTALGAAFAVRTGQARAAAATFLKERVFQLIRGLARWHGTEGILARTWPTGSMVLWVAILLGAYVIFYLRP